MHSGQLEAGWQRINLSAFNDYAAQAGYTTIKPFFPGAQFVFHSFIDDWVVGGKACGYMVQQPVEPQTSFTIFRYYYGTMHLGRVLWQTQNDNRTLRLYPTLGAGFGSSLVRLEKSPNFKNYTGSGFLADAALNLSWFQSMAGDPNNMLMLSVNAGYAYGAGWNISPAGTALSTAPTGPYLRVGMGMCSIKR